MNVNGKKYLYTLVGIAVLITIWETVALILNEPLLFPSPFLAIKEFFSLLSSPALPTALLTTGLRALVGFLIAFLLGCALGILGYRYPCFKHGFAPFITVLRSVPTMSIILVVVIWFSPSVGPAIIGFLIIFPTIYQSFLSALDSVDKNLIEMSKVYRISNKDKLFGLYLPSIRKNVLASARSQISLNVKVVIAGEVLAYTAKSIGMQMYITKIDIATGLLFGWTIYAVLLSFLFESAVVLIDYLTDPKTIRNRKRKKCSNKVN